MSQMIALAELAVYGAVASGDDAVQPLYVGPAFKLQPDDGGLYGCTYQ